MRRWGRWLSMSVAIPILLAGGILGAAGLAGATGRATSLNGTWRGAILVRIAGSLEGGFTISAAESTYFLGCEISTGSTLGRYSRQSGSRYSVEYMSVTSSTTQGQEGVKCDYETLGPITVDVSLSGNTLSVSGCGDACWKSGSSFTRVGPAKPATTTKPKPTTTKPTTKAATVRQGAYVLLKSLMARYGSNAFSKLVSLGDLKTYRLALIGVKVKIDPTLSDNALWNPKTKTISFRKDPSTIAPGEDPGFEESVWHEVTHVIEYEHGDGNTVTALSCLTKACARLYDERHIEYMVWAGPYALKRLAVMEEAAKRGKPVAFLREKWREYLADTAKARKRPETKKYPPDLKLLRKWFGFHVPATDAIRNLYLSGKALPGPAGARLREAVRNP